MTELIRKISNILIYELRATQLSNLPNLDPVIFFIVSIGQI